MPSIAAELDHHSVKRVHVAVGVIVNERQQIFVAQRAQHLHQGGLWEFPGGKVEPNETVFDALQRELHEELGITVTQASPFIRISHDYADKAVLLDVWRVTAWQGTPRSMDAQPSAWVDVAQLSHYEVPRANARIVSALRLPREMMITGAWSTQAEFDRRLTNALEKGICLVQLRAHQCSEQELQSLAQHARNLCAAHGAQLMINTTVECFEKIIADDVRSASTDLHLASSDLYLTALGLHLTSAELMRCDSRPVPKNILLGASCHTLAEIHHANRIGVNYVTLGSVFATATHPDAQPMGIAAFEKRAKESQSLVYALGGMKPEHLSEIESAGGYGIAAISAWW